MTVAQHASRTFEQQEREPNWFVRVWQWWLSTKAPVREDWTETESAQTLERPELQPTHTLPAAPPQPPVQQPRPAHPQFAMQPASMSHVLDRMQHLLVDLRSDPSMTAVKAAEALRGLNVELSGYAQHEFDQQRRMERNQADAQAQAALLADAVRRGKEADGLRQATEGIAGRAVHVADPDPTGVMPKITDDMPDPRTVNPRTVAQPVDVNPGDVEPAESPVHSDGAPAIPEPTAAFLGGSGEFALPRREPQSPLAHEVPDAAPTAVLPVQGDRTAVMPAFAGAGVADPGEGSDDD